MGTWMSPDHEEYGRLQDHNHLFRLTFAVFMGAATSPAKTTFGLENPARPKDKSCASMFSTDEARELRENYDARDYVFDQCQLRPEAQKAYTVAYERRHA